ncbi:nicotinamide N-methyltransferase-like [Phyllobates terribilis]|uniref:nicotinamide N-methyltransferase-like n=1 Tax=Phyllobates terribilis TaxID=111132 RepID=UPI003CCAEC5D
MYGRMTFYMKRRTHDMIYTNLLCKLIPGYDIKTLSREVETDTLSVIEDQTMDSATYKLYHVDDFDPRQHLEDYVANDPDGAFEEDSLIFPIENLIKTFTEGHIKGDVLIDLSHGSLVHHLFAACEFFKHVIVLRANDRCILELKRWVNKRTGAFDWSHVTKLYVESSDQ